MHVSFDMVVDFFLPSARISASFYKFIFAVFLLAAFESFDEFYEEYKRWAEHGHHPFTVDKSHAAKEAKGSAETGWVDRIKYVRVRYACVHRGTPIYRGQGKRPNQTYMGKNCKAHLSIKCDKNIVSTPKPFVWLINGLIDWLIDWLPVYSPDFVCQQEFHNTAGDKLKGKIVVSEINEDHNHEISADLFKVYRQNRVLGTDELKRAKQLLGDKAGADVVAKTLSEMSGKVVSKKDVYNLGSKLRAGEDGKHSRRHYREDSVPASMAPTVSLLPEFQDEIVIDQESVEEVESSKSKSKQRIFLTGVFNGTNWFNEWLIAWSTDRLIDCWNGCSIVGLTYWLIDWLNITFRTIDFIRLIKELLSA